MSASRPITENDLHAYVDGLLDIARHAEIETYLAAHPDIARRIEGYKAQRIALRTRLGPVMDEPVPPELSLSRIVEQRRPTRPMQWRALAAAFAMFVVGTGTGWVLNDRTVPPTGGVIALAREAADTYRVFGPEMSRPVEIRATDSSDLVKWVSRRLQRPIEVPDLVSSGFRFMGGRLVATPHGPAGMFLYDNAGKRVVLLIRTMADAENAPLSEHVLGTVSGVTWATGGVGYSLVGETTSDALHRLANEIRYQFES